MFACSGVMIATALALQANNLRDGGRSDEMRYANGSHPELSLGQEMKWHLFSR